MKEQKISLIKQLRASGIKNESVLDAIDHIPRDQFIDQSLKPYAYANTALEIGHGQTISQPYIVARMTEMLLAGDTPIRKVLEIGTGCGYQASILAQLVDEVYSIERIRPLYEKAKQRLEALEIHNVQLLYGDGYAGWPNKAPFDGILVTAATPEVPSTLENQLADKGRMIIPIGRQMQTQELTLFEKNGEKLNTTLLDPVLFVPMLTGTTDH